MHHTKVYLGEIFAKIIVGDVENTIITATEVRKETCFVLVLDNIIPKSFILLTSLTCPFGVSPRISKFEHSVMLAIFVLKSSGIYLLL
jgi:hypothetical protein